MNKYILCLALAVFILFSIYELSVCVNNENDTRVNSAGAVDFNNSMENGISDDANFPSPILQLQKALVLTPDIESDLNKEKLDNYFKHPIVDHGEQPKELLSLKQRLNKLNRTLRQ